MCDRRWIVAAVAAALLAGGPTLAAAAGGSGKADELPAFDKADGNDDGRLSLEEARQIGISEKRFEKEDLDGDGHLSRITYQYDLRQDESSG